MSRTTTKQPSLVKKIIFGLLALSGVVIVGIVIMGMFNGGKSSKSSEVNYKTVKAEEGNLASSTLLTGTVKATEEQYVYYDANKGNLSNVAVNVGDQVEVGQVLASYDSTEAQRQYDAAVRALNKVDRQIYELKTYGQTTTTTGDEATDSQNTASAQRSADSQLKDLNDARADAVDTVNKAQEALNAMSETSKVKGTVVEVNRDVSTGTTTSAQTVVHVVNNASLVVEGEMSEYNLANIAVDQEVTLTSKVYPDDTWTGKVSYISDYPATSSEAAAPTSGSGSSGGGTASKYPFKVALTSELGKLKQGFTINVEVNSNQKGILVPIDAVLTGDKDSYYVYTYDNKKKTIKRVAVEIGAADGANQQITSGLTSGDTVIANPSKDLKDGQEVTVDGKKTD